MFYSHVSDVFDPRADLYPPPGGNALAWHKSETSPPPQVNALAWALLGKDASRPFYMESWAAAKYGNELQKPFWTTDEAVPALLGIDPELKPMSEFAKNEFREDIATEAMRLRRLVSAALVMGDLPHLFRPAQLINWALTQHIPVPDKLLELAVERGLPIVGHLSPADRWKMKFQDFVRKASENIAARDARIEALELELSSRGEEILRLRDQKAGREPSVQQPQVPEPAPTNTNTSGLSRKFNNAAKYFYVLANVTCGVEFKAMEKVNLKKLLVAFEKKGLRPDDETLVDYLRHGAEQLARGAKSQN